MFVAGVAAALSLTGEAIAREGYPHTAAEIATGMATTTESVDGDELFEASCSTCHGEEGGQQRASAEGAGEASVHFQLTTGGCHWPTAIRRCARIRPSTNRSRPWSPMSGASVKARDTRGRSGGASLRRSGAFHRELRGMSRRDGRRRSRGQRGSRPQLVGRTRRPDSGGDDRGPRRDAEVRLPTPNATTS